MKILKKLGAVLGALALSASLSVGLVSQADAAVEPVVSTTVTGMTVGFEVTGCSTVDGATGVSYLVLDGDIEVATGVIETSTEAEVAATGEFTLEDAGDYSLVVTCAGEDEVEASASAEFVIEQEADDEAPAPTFAPVVTVTNVDEDGIIPGNVAVATIEGCSTDLGAQAIRVWLVMFDIEGYLTDLGTLDAPAAGGSVTVEATTPFPALYGIVAQCFATSEEAQNASFDEEASGYWFAAIFGELRVVPPTWLTGDTVTVSSKSFEHAGSTVHAFDTESEVRLTVLGPDDKEYDLGTFTTDANGFFSEDVVLPFDADGEYTVVASGERNGFPVILVTYYEPLRPTDPPATPPAEGKPTALPKTGSEGVNLVSAAALISVVAGGAAVALRSRKQ